MLHAIESNVLKMFINNAVQKIIQTNKNGEFSGHVQIKTGNKQPHFCTAFQMEKSSTAFRFPV